MNAENLTTTIIKTERPNSYEFGKAGNRFKLFFDSAEDLKKQIEKLKELGIYQELE